MISTLHQSLHAYTCRGEECNPQDTNPVVLFDFARRDSLGSYRQISMEGDRICRQWCLYLIHRYWKCLGTKRYPGQNSKNPISLTSRISPHPLPQPSGSSLISFTHISTPRYCYQSKAPSSPPSNVEESRKISSEGEVFPESLPAPSNLPVVSSPTQQSRARPPISRFEKVVKSGYLPPVGDFFSFFSLQTPHRGSLR